MGKYRDMQTENKVLLKKMLSIDIKPSSLNPTKILEKQVPSHQSLNRISRLKELIRVNQENRVRSHITFIHSFIYSLRYCYSIISA